MKKAIVLLFVLSVAVVAGCAKNSMDVSYDENSWQNLIADSCKNFFDGCNQCVRMADGAACTRMFCETYAEPYCTDEDDVVVDDAIVEATPDIVVDSGSDIRVFYVGLSLQDAMNQAQANWVLFRVIEQDGEPLPATMDLRPGRINASVANGVVVDIFVE